MKNPVKVRFESVATVINPTKEEKQTILASVQEHKELFASWPINPGDNEFILIRGQGYCAGKNNKNGHLISNLDSYNLSKTFPFKFVDLEHNRNHIVGVCVSCGYSTPGANSRVLSEDEIKLNYVPNNIPFDVDIFALIWKRVSPEFCEILLDSQDSKSPLFGCCSFSWELEGNGYEIIISPTDLLKDGKVVPEADEERFLPYLKPEGNGKIGDKEIFCLITNPVALGMGIVKNPAGYVNKIDIKDANVPSVNPAPLTANEIEALFPLTHEKIVSVPPMTIPNENQPIPKPDSSEVKSYPELKGEKIEKAPLSKEGGLGIVSKIKYNQNHIYDLNQTIIPPKEELLHAAGEKSDKSTVLFNVPADHPVLKDIQDYISSIPDESVYNEEGKHYGKETEPHITALYGIKGNDIEGAKKALKEFGPIKATLGCISAFLNHNESGKLYDVLKIDIHSDDLARLNKRLRENTNYESEFKVFKPHLTLAYFKKSGKMARFNTANINGLPTFVLHEETVENDQNQIIQSSRNDWDINNIQAYLGDNHFEGKEIIFNEAIFSNSDRQHFKIPLVKTSISSIFSSEKNNKNDKIISPAISLANNESVNINTNKIDNKTIISINPNMKFTKLEEVTAALKEKDEVLASATSDFIKEELKKSSEAYSIEANKGKKDLEAALASLATVSASAKALEEKMAAIEQTQAAAAKLASFNERMASLEADYDMDDASRKAVAKSIKDLDDGCYADWKANVFAALYASRSKAALKAAHDKEEKEKADAKVKADEEMMGSKMTDEEKKKKEKEMEKDKESKAAELIKSAAAALDAKDKLALNNETETLKSFAEKFKLSLAGVKVNGKELKD